MSVTRTRYGSSSYHHIEIGRYYPYGLSIVRLSRSDEYLNIYTGKELQTGEFDPLLSSGLEMFDFHARFYDPALGRWFVPDPAEQFANPYLAMGNNPVVYVDPDGEFVFFIPHISFNGSLDVGFTVGLGFRNFASVQATVGYTFQEGDDNMYASVGGSFGGVTASVGYGTQTGYTAGVGFESSRVSWSQNYGANFSAFSSAIGYSRGFAFGSNNSNSSSVNPLDDPNLTASIDDAPAVGYVNLKEFETVGRLSPYQRYMQWAKNSQMWYRNEAYLRNRRHYSGGSSGHLGTISVGVTFEVAFPNNWAPINGIGYSAGLVADYTNTGLGGYVTRKNPIGDYGLTLNMGLKFSYSHSSTAQQVVIERLNGSGRSVSGGIGPYGGEFGRDNKRTYSQFSGSVGLGLDFGSAEWNTNTTIYPWLR